MKAQVCERLNCWHCPQPWQQAEEKQRVILKKILVFLLNPQKVTFGKHQWPNSYQTGKEEIGKVEKNVPALFLFHLNLQIGSILVRCKQPGVCMHLPWPSARGNPQHKKGIITISMTFSSLVSLKSSSSRLVFSCRSLPGAHTASSEQETLFGFNSASPALMQEQRCCNEPKAALQNPSLSAASPIAMKCQVKAWDLVV